MTRTHTASITFENPFVLHGYKNTLPAGTYRVDTEEEQIEGISFPAFRRTQVSLFLPKNPEKPGISEILSFNPHELDAAQARDARKVQPAEKHVPCGGMIAAKRLDQAAKQALDNMPQGGLWLCESPYGPGS